jgi:hypothetical protein
MNYFALFFLIFAFMFPPLTSAAEASDTACTPIFNGGQTCIQSDLLTINKKVLNPTLTFKPGQTFKDSDFVENVTMNDTTYPANRATAFRLTITNTANRKLSNIKVADILPAKYLTYVTGDGSYDSGSRTFSATIDSLDKNQTKTYTIQVVTAMADQLPANNTPVCTVNQATATVSNKKSQDNAMLCLQASPSTAVTPTRTAFAPQQKSATPTQGATTKGGLPVAKTTPAPTNPPTTKGGQPVYQPAPSQETPGTGPEMLGLLGLLPTGALGWFLRKKTHQSS